MKLFEYMAGGKPIVATDLPECRDRPGVFVARSRDEFISHVDTAYSRRSDPEYVQTLDEHARANTWDVRIQLLLEAAFGS